MTHDQLVEQTRQAINRVFGDTSVDRAQTRCSLNELLEEIEILLDALPVDGLVDEEEADV